MSEHHLDFTNTFSNISNKNYINDNISDFLKEWRTFDIDYNLMKETNPIVIPRNHLVDQALKAAEQNDLKPFKELMKILSQPFNYDLNINRYLKEPNEDERVTKTYCGT